MIRERLYITALGVNSFRQDEPAEITGVFRITPFDNLNFALPSRLCYQITFGDGQIDYIPLSEITEELFHIFTLKEIYGK